MRKTSMAKLRTCTAASVLAAIVGFASPAAASCTGIHLFSGALNEKFLVQRPGKQVDPGAGGCGWARKADDGREDRGGGTGPELRYRRFTHRNPRIFRKD